MNRYGKIINGNLILASSALVIGNEQVFNASDEDYKSQGYLEIEYATKPADDGEYIATYKEVDGKIVQEWKYKGVMHSHKNKDVLDDFSVEKEELRWRGLQLGGGGSTKTIPIVSTLPETAKDGDVVLFAPKSNIITIFDQGKTIYMDYSWIENYNGESFVSQVAVECDEGQVYFYIEHLGDDEIHFTYTVERDVVYNTNYGELYWRFDADQNRYVFDAENSFGVNAENGETVYFPAPPEEFKLFDNFTAEPICENPLPFTWLYIKPEFMVCFLGTWNKLIAVPTKTSELENDSGFITADDIPQGNLSQFIEETASSVNLYPPMVDGWTDNAFLKSDGSASSQNAYCITPKITVKPETTYTIKPLPWGKLADANKGRCYDEQGKPLAQVTWTINGDSATFTTPTNTAYVRFSVLKSDFDNQPTNDKTDINLIIPIFNNTFMLVEGTTAPEKYEPYGQGKYRLKDIDIPLKSVNIENVNNKALPIFAPLAGKKIANFGDSIFGNARPPEDVSTYLAEKAGAEVLNCAFGGCRMAIHNQLGHWNAFTMVNLAQAIESGDYSVQDEALNYDDRTSYAEQPLSVIKAADFSTVDILTIAYGTNDFTSNIPLENAENPYDTATFAGALRTSIESLLTAYPNLKIFVLSTMYRFYIDSNNDFTEDSNTRVNSIGLKLSDYNAKLQAVAAEYNLPYVDDYNIGIGKFNRYQYFNANDGTHHNEAGRRFIAEHLANALCGGDNNCLTNGVYERIEAPTNTKILPNKEYVFGEVTELTVSFAESTIGKRNEYLFSFISGETATVLTLPSSVKWVNELTVEANKRYEISVVDDVALWCAVDMAVSE